MRFNFLRYRGRHRRKPLAQAEVVNGQTILPPKGWPRIWGGDPNLWDVGLVAERVASGMYLADGTPPTIEMVLAIEEHFVAGVEIRELPGPELFRRYTKVLDVLDGGGARRFAQAAWLWCGCIEMAKMTRRTYMVGPAKERAYTMADRWRSYDLMRLVNVRELDRGNPWLLYGMMLAQDLSRSRGDYVLNSWIPPSSPYWLTWQGRRVGDA